MVCSLQQSEAAAEEYKNIPVFQLHANINWAPRTCLAGRTEMQSGKCAVCLAEAALQCAGCRSVFYCGKGHQKSHWSGHKAQCRPVIVQEHPVLGRHLVATRDIKQGELIIREAPLLLGPKIASTPICLGCNQEADLNCPCPGCGWPMCSLDCSSALAHQGECHLMQTKEFRAKISEAHRPLPDYAFITPLRALLLPPNKLATLRSLQSHLETRKKTPLYNLLKYNVVSFIKDRLGLNFSEDEILEACAILDTNAFEMRCGKMRFRGIFPQVAMMAHDCIPNTRHLFDSNNTLELFATVNIKKDQSVTATYTQPFWGTLARRAHLRSAKCFDCACQRCADPEELETYLGAIRCSECDEGMVISESPLEDMASWTCKLCGCELPAEQIYWLNQSITKEIELLDKSGPDQLEMFLEKYQEILHTSNGHVLQVKLALVQIYGNKRSEDMSEEQQVRKISLAEELLQVLAILEPGITRTRAQLQMELQPVKVLRAKADFEAGNLSKEQTESTINTAIQELQIAADVLKTEPELTVKSLEKLQFVSSLKSLLG
ncbi:SET domain-containing protein SmydA-8-like [Neocloeon triangulifer]|uniref:SET domain-containing protein SmydA-8-like n=1 Tax=Neocloeon triangulifer TaxID=2078957 RepID=UPI00286ED147|nr:SET domain-containing protein SmydA-8-like [Neocloeon triangulifer]